MKDIKKPLRGKRVHEVLRRVAAIALGMAILFCLVFWETLFGLAALKVFKWEEESFVGRPLSELENFVMRQGGYFVPIHSDSFSTRADRIVTPNQRAMYFTKGKDYSWFGVGSATNLGYVLLEEVGGVEKVVTIVRGQSIDGP